MATGIVVILFKQILAWMVANMLFFSPYLRQMLPPLLLKSLQHVKGFHQPSFEAVHQSGNQVTSIRINPQKSLANYDLELTNEPPSSPIPWCPHGFYLEQRPSFTLDPTFHAGAYYVQEASSMFLWEVLKQTVVISTSKKVLDLCAAPGGKSTLLSSYFIDGLVVSNDVIKSRANILVENIAKWGNDNVVVTNNDPKDFSQLPIFFDVVVVDAPCSGSGLFRKDANAMDEWSLANVQLCSQRQQRILADVLPALKEGGIMIYSTCSYSAEEDENICDWLMDEFSMESIQLQIPEKWNIVETISDNGSYGYRFYPDKIKGEGFFIAAFKKISSSEEIKFKEQPLLMPSKQDLQVMQSFIQLPANYIIFKHSNFLRAMPEQWFSALKTLSAYLYIKKAGIDLGAVKGKDFVPQHELAISQLAAFYPVNVELTLDQSLQYLRRKEINLDAFKGWTLVKYNGHVLGWIKVLPNRINNYYPTEWRILKA